VATSDAENNAEHIDSMLDEIIKNFVTEAKGNPQRDDPLAAAMTDGAMVAMSRLTVRASELEKALLAQILARWIAEALAPELARTLAPEILTILSRADPEHLPGARADASRR
jgi:hypothetical protein